ncbi:MAG: CRISPR-associated endonuclease Cas1 [Chromatiaceae bacterium]
MSGHLALVVDQPGATLETGTHETLVLVHADGRRERIGLRALGSVVLHGVVRFDTALLQALTAHNVALTVLSCHGRAPALGFTPLPHRHVLLRHRQHLAYADPARRLTLARTVLLAKLEAMAEFARDHAPDRETAQYRAMHAACAAPDLATLMGVEGAASARHFESLAAIYPGGGDFAFDGRSRRPPENAPNALMSLSYTLAQSLATQVALHAGLDVQLGFLHTLHRDRDSLALDLVEPARARLDAWVQDLLVGRRLLKPDLFTPANQGPVWLSKEGRSLFYPVWFREGHRVALAPMRRLLAQMLGLLRQVPLSGEAATDALSGLLPDIA